MGQKVNPNGLRLGINKDWEAKWYSNKKDFANTLGKDIEITDIPENTPYFVSKEGFETISGVVEAADENGTIQIELV